MEFLEVSIFVLELIERALDHLSGCFFFLLEVGSGVNGRSEAKLKLFLLKFCHFRFFSLRERNV